MKKIYSQPEWKIVNFIAEDVITESVTHTFNPDNFDNGNSDNWDW